MSEVEWKHVDDDAGRRNFMAWVDGAMVAYLSHHAKGRSWWCDPQHQPAVAAALLERWDDLLDEGLEDRRHWSLWDCGDCDARPLQPCRHLVTDKTLKWCHRGRRPL